MNAPFMAVPFCYLDLSAEMEVRVLHECGEPGPSGEFFETARVVLGPRGRGVLTPQSETLYLTHSGSLEEMAVALEALARWVRVEAQAHHAELGDLPEEVAGC